MEGKLVLLVLLAGCLAVTRSKPLDQIYKLEKYVLYTSADSTENDHSLSVEGRRSLVFKVRACHSVHLLMAGVLNHESMSTYLTIGAGQNTMTILTHVANGKHFGSTNTPNILHCNELRTFWVSWAYGYLRFGRGSAIGVEMLLNEQKTDELAHDVTAISLFTVKGIAAVWEIEENQFVNLVTTPKEDTNMIPYTWRTVQHAPGNQFSFSIKACQNVDVFLGESIGAGEYRISFSQNGGKTSIIRGNEELASNTTKTIDCESYKMFYVSWRLGRITLGSGNTKYRGILVDVADTGIGDVYALGFGAGSNAMASFDFPATIDEMYTFTTFASSPIQYQNWMHVAESNTVQFLVQACKDVTVVFSDTIGTVSDNAFILEIAPGGSNFINIKKKDGSTVTSTNANILDCNYPTGLWASFTDNKFRLGKSTLKGVETMLAADAELDGRMTGIGFASSDGAQAAEWTIATIESGVLRLTTKDNVEDYNTWASGTRRYFKEFRMDMCGDMSSIHLTPCQGCRNMGSTGSYHILFERDGSNDKVSIVFRFGGNETVLDSTTLSGITQCGEYRSFFVNWYEDRITLGRGDLTSGEVLLQLVYGFKLPYIVDAIALDSSGETKWEMAMESWEQLSFQKQSADVGYSWIKLTRSTWQRFWATGSSVDLFLCETYGQTMNGYKITISSGTSTIQRNGAQVASSNAKIIDNKHRNYLVLSWLDGEIRLGPEVGGTAFLNYKDNSPMTITGMGIDPNGDAAEVRLPHSFVSETTFNTAPASILTPAWMDLFYHDNLLFKVKSASEAKIVLAPYMFHADVNTYYQVTIGDNGNKETTIKQDGQVLASYQTENILSADQESSFWIQWYHGEIILGRGEHIGNDIIVTFYDPSPAPIMAAAFDGNYRTEWTVGLVPQGNVAGPDPETSGGGLSGGQIAGIVIGVLFLVALIGGFAFMYRSGKMQSFTNSLPPPSGAGSNKPQQFDNPLSYPDNNSVPSGQTAA